MNNQLPSDQIDAYLMGELSAPEATLFEQQLVQDKTLAQEIEIRKAVLEQVTTLGHLRDKKKILAIQRRVEQKRRTKRMRITFMTIAASLLCLLIGYQLLDSQPVHLQLYSQNYEAYPLPFASRGADTEQLWSEAGVFYQKEDFAKALPLFQKINADAPAQSKVLLAIGICQLELNQHQQAIQTFSVALQNNKALYQDQAHWYLALAYLHQDDKETAKTHLKLLTDDENADFHNKAKALISSF